MSPAFVPMYISLGARTNKWLVTLDINPGSPATKRFKLVLSLSAALTIFTYVSKVLNGWVAISGSTSLVACHRLSL